MKKSKGITRVDQPSTRTHGYVVRVGWKKTRKGWRPKKQGFFADKGNGGKRNTYRTACAWANYWTWELRATKKGA